MQTRPTPAATPAATPDRSRASRARRWTQLVVGFAGWGLAAALMIRADLGLGPWDAFHVGVSLHTGLQPGTVSMLTGAGVLVASLPFGLRPGLGTVANMIAIGAFMNVFLRLLPSAPTFAWGLGYFTAALVLAGWFTGMYVGANLGAGPRDGLVLHLAERTGRSVRQVRTAVELSVLGAGWALGGPLGWGTLIFAAGIGPCMQWGLRRWNALPAPPGPSPRTELARAA